MNTYDEGGTLEPGRNLIRNDLGKPEPLVRPTNDIQAGIAYIKKRYGPGGELGHGYMVPKTDPEKLAAFRAKVEAAQPRLKVAIADYLALAGKDGLLPELAALHSPENNSRHPDCRECTEIEWPCATAETIANACCINLTDAHLYRWEDK